MIRAIVMAAATWMKDAIRIWPSGSGITPWRNVAYRTITVPAMQAMPTVMSEKSSLLVMLLRYGLITSGASTMPRKIVVEAPRPSAPPMFMVFWRTKEKA